MCSVVILHRPGHPWPVMLAANRDEMRDRPWAPPGRHWPDRPNVVAGRDLLAGGSWLGVNDQGVVAGILNRMNTLGPQPGRRSRGELVLEALDHADAAEAAWALADLDPRAYRSFNLVIADSRNVFWLRHLGEAAEGVEVMPLPAGVSMITAHDRNDETGSGRIRNFLPRFRAAPPPDPEADDWAAWDGLLSSRDTGGGSPYDAMTVVTDAGFGTVSSAVIAVPAPDPEALRRPVWRFAAGVPGEAPYLPVSLGRRRGEPA